MRHPANSDQKVRVTNSGRLASDCGPGTGYAAPAPLKRGVNAPRRQRLHIPCVSRFAFWAAGVESARMIRAPVVDSVVASILVAVILGGMKLVLLYL